MPSTSSSKDSILVELFHFQDSLHIFIVRSEFKEPKVITQKLTIEKMDTIFKELLRNMFIPIDQWSKSNWNELSELICRPLRAYLKEWDRIIFVPHRSFHFLPLHLLILDKRPLIDEHSIVYLPSASVLQYCQQKNPLRNNQLSKPCSLAAFGLDFEKEVDDVAKHFESSVVFHNSEKSITKEIILSSCVSADIVHFSGHGIFQVGDPDGSGLVLNGSNEHVENGLKIFNLHDIYNLKLNSYLVTLGACNTGLGDYQAGDELLGIVRGFLYAGTPTVLASLWPVPNKATIALMDSFYSYLLDKKLDKADSLRSAQIEVRKKFPNVFEWAGFAIIGDWM